MKKLLLALNLVAIGFTSLAADITVKDNNGNGTGTTTWTKDNTYILDGFVFVNSGQTLTIEAGTIIKGKPGTGSNASALIVARGAKINAVGTATEPIIFTAESDAPNTLNELGVDQKGLWGGLIVLGDASLGFASSETNIEGIPTTETRGLYGGTNDADNSGTLKYVSVRHGGSNIGADNEINGITFGGVGSGTTVDYVEVIANQDDGIEFFGGTVSVKHAAVSYCGDDSFDYDFGWRGNGQFWLVLQDANSDRGGEHDGAKPDDATPFSNPTIYNVTYIGNGTSKAITFRDGTAGKYYNSIFHNFGKGIDVENTGDITTPKGAKVNLDAGELIIADNVFSKIAAGNTLDKLILEVNKDNKATLSSLEAHSSVTGNMVQDLDLGSMYFVPGTGENLADGTAPAEAWFDKVTYKGAFEHGKCDTWIKGWTRVIWELNACPVATEDVVEAAESIVTYPNPTADVVNFKEVEDQNVKVFNMAGSLVKSSAIVNGQLDLANVDSGVYFVKVNKNNVTTAVKVIVE